MTQPFVICTDSAADLPWLTALSQKVDIVPLQYSTDGAVFTGGPGSEADAAALYFAMRNGAHVQTFPAQPEQYAALWEPHLAAGRDVLMLSVSRFLGGSFLAAQAAREDLLSRYSLRRIVIVDTLSASAAQGMLVNEAAMMRQDGAALDEVADWALDSRLCVNGLVLPGNLKWLRAGGFFSGGAMGELLGRRLLLEMDGTGALQQAARCKDDEDAILAILDCVQEMAYEPARQVMAVTHIDAPELAALVREALIREIGCDDAAILPMGPIAGAHVGPDTVAVAFYGQSR